MVVVLEKAQQTTGWEYGQTFSTATTTSVSTGINLDAGWVSASGSVTMEGSSATTKTVSIDSELDRAKANKYDIRATTPYGHYDCFSFANPNAGHKIMETASKGYWMDSTFAGIEWQIDDNQYIIPVNCNGIPPRSRFDRENGTSETIDTSWSITMSGKIDFIGKASAKASFDTSHADDHGVSQHMSNKTGATKYVCGDSGPPLAPDSDTTWLLTHRYS